MDKKESKSCLKCEELRKRGGWDTIDLLIYHNNGHVWPGYAGEPGPINFGGSDF